MSLLPTVTEVLAARGIPNRRVEGWKYSDLRSALDALPTESNWHAGLLITVPELIENIGLRTDEPPDWALARLKEPGDNGAMDAAARTLVRSISLFRVAAGAKPELPMRIEHFGPGHGSNAVFVEAGASLTIVEEYQAGLDLLSNTSLLLFLDEDAEVTLRISAPFVSSAVVVETVSVLQAANSRLRVNVLDGGGKLSRIELNVTLAGEGADADLSGVSVLGNGAHADITTRIDHAVPNTTSRQLFKKVAGGKSRAVYQGKIIVREGAVGSDSRQTAKALLLSDRAEADLKPELEILADDVKCAHGAAVGDLDADSLFYLRSRGIPEAEARKLLVHAFLQEVVDGIEDESLRGTAVEFIDNGLAWAMESAP